MRKPIRPSTFGPNASDRRARQPLKTREYPTIVPLAFLDIILQIAIARDCLSVFALPFFTSELFEIAGRLKKGAHQAISLVILLQYSSDADRFFIGFCFGPVCMTIKQHLRRCCTFNFWGKTLLSHRTTTAPLKKYSRPVDALDCAAKNKISSRRIGWNNPIHLSKSDTW